MDNTEDIMEELVFCDAMEKYRFSHNLTEALAYIFTFTSNTQKQRNIMLGFAKTEQCLSTDLMKCLKKIQDQL
jgi:hypothetical protein